MSDLGVESKAMRAAMWSTAWLTALALAAGCSWNAAAPTPPAAPSASPAEARSALTHRYEALVTATCTCRDLACSARATATFAGSPDRGPTDAAELERWAADPAVAQLSELLGECTGRLAKTAARERRRRRGGGTARQMMDSYAGFVDQVCACRDQACVSQATEDYGRANAEAARDMDPEAAREMAEDPKMMELTKRMVDCATKMATAAAAAATPTP